MTEERDIFKVDQKRYWDARHTSRELEFIAQEGVPNDFAVNCARHMSDGSIILEVGAATGRDARYFIKTKDAKVIANDISAEALRQLKYAAERDGTTMSLIPIESDARDLFDYLNPEVKFDVLYARSALHLSDTDLDKFFAQLGEHMDRGGRLMIQGKTMDDFKMNGSIDIGKNCYEDAQGHIRRCWSEQSIRDLCHKHGYLIMDMRETIEKIEGNDTKFIHFIAQKI